MNVGEMGEVRDDALIRATLEGDEEAFRELMERYKGRAFGVAVGIVGNGDDALDVVQDSFIKAYYKLREFRFGSNFYTWFYRLLVNQAIDRWRKSARSAEVPLDESWLSEEDSPPDAFTYPRTPEDLARNRELGDALQRAIASLPEYHRAVIVLREVEGMAYDEIAKTLGCSVGTVMSRLHYARGKLKEALKPHREG
ncbi:MAG TPA: sigma-70 family RNA polymerase sigma factor [Candidatus Deferrimicrobiaceae bacterium]|nr:sigma-70 family RNA polymerase sigma factor [Candidatus Deferrimicrobiaceae bacterium]